MVVRVVPEPRPLRAAIIGTGRIGSRLEKDPLRAKPHSHAGWYAAHPRTRLVAGADTCPEALAEFGADWNLASAHLYRDYREMLARERPDIVSVCAFAPERVQMCEAAVHAGARGLWVEKAVACSIEEADHLDRLTASHGVTVIVDQPRRADTRYRALARLIAGSDFGRLETVHVLFSGHAVHTGTHAWDVLDLWCGPWDTLQAWLDAPAPVEVHADGRQAPRTGPDLHDAIAPGRLVDGGGHVHLTYASGVQVFASGRRKGYFVFQFDLVFEGGRIQLGNDICRVFRPAPSPRYSGLLELAEAGLGCLQDERDAYPHPMLHDLVHAMDTGRAPLMSLRHGITSLRTAVAVLQSAAGGTRLQSPAEVDPSLYVVSR